MSDQPQTYRLMGLDPSPYTVKVASYFAFKGIDYQWPLVVDTLESKV